MVLFLTLLLLDCLLQNRITSALAISQRHEFPKSIFARQEASQCGPGSEDDQRCPLNTCCSHSGWCGTSQAHCSAHFSAPCQPAYGTCRVVPSPTCPFGSSADQRTIAYYASWASRDRLCDRITPRQINTSGLTHINFAFIWFDPNTFAPMFMDYRDQSLITEFISLKSSSLHTWIVVGGYTFNNPGRTQGAFSNMVRTAANRARFITQLEAFMRRYGFQGVDLDWEYPGDPARGGMEEDREGFLALVREMREAWGNSYGISLALPYDLGHLQYFDVKGLGEYVDFMGFMSYDLHHYQDHSGIIRPHSDILEIDDHLEPLWFAGVSPSKIILGTAYYGHNFRLTNPSCNTIGCAHSGPGEGGPCTGFAGLMGKKEIRDMLNTDRTLRPQLDRERMVKTLVYGRDIPRSSWLAYDDEETLGMKKDWASRRCLGGTMIWSIDFDAQRGS